MKRDNKNPLSQSLFVKCVSTTCDKAIPLFQGGHELGGIFIRSLNMNGPAAMDRRLEVGTRVYIYNRLLYNCLQYFKYNGCCLGQCILLSYCKVLCNNLILYNNIDGNMMEYYSMQYAIILWINTLLGKKIQCNARQCN